MTTMNDAPLGYMPIPTAEQLAEALANVRCFHDLSAELIAPELLANLLAAISAQQSAHVSVPRELLGRAMYAKDGHELIEANRELRALLNGGEA